MQQQKHRNSRRRYTAPIGGIFVLLALIGVVTVIVASLRLTSRAFDNTGEKERFEEIILPVLIFDPVPFESPEDIEMQNLLLYSMWATLTSERARNYTYNENQEMMIPASDLDVAAANLFGGEIQLEHQTFSDYSDSTYAYDKDKNSYHIRVSAQLYVYTPDVREIAKEGDLYRLDVYYTPPGDAWNMTKTKVNLSPFGEKHMYYYMRKGKDSYQLVKIADPPSAEPVS